MAAQVDEYDNGYDTDHEHVLDHHVNHDNPENLVFTEEHTLLVKNYILECIKSEHPHDIRQLFDTIIEQRIIKANHQDYIDKPYKCGIINDFYLHNPELDDKIDWLLSPSITKTEYDILDSINPCIKSLDYGCKFIDTIKFYTDYIIIIFPLDEQTNTQKILKIDRKNDIKEPTPILSVYESGTNIILDWNPFNGFGRDITKLSKLVFKKYGVVTDMYWTNAEGLAYRAGLLPSHIALRPNRFNMCWYLEYNSILVLEDKPDDIVNFTIECCDS
jgi:hypothetical protein